MKIATWNIERLKHIKELDKMQDICNDIHADIMVLTESDVRMKLDYSHTFHTEYPNKNPITGDADKSFYLPTERRVSIFTDYSLIRMHDTFDAQTALCLELNTGFGNLLVYGTIIGILGNRNPSFNKDLDSIVTDIQRLSSMGLPICICGDYNCTFSDNYYFAKHGRDSLMKVLQNNNICITTANRPECIDHIAVSNSYLYGSEIHVEEWNLDKKLSDHKGIAISFETSRDELNDTDKVLYVAHRFSSNNKAQLEKDKICGCFNCLRIFSPSEIDEWVPETLDGECVTAICPYCGVDSIIGESSGFPITKEFFKKMKSIWFS